MYNDRTFMEELKFRFNYGGMHVKLIFINAIVFLVLGIIQVFTRLLGHENGWIDLILVHVFTLDASFWGLITKPWGLFTSMFAHFGFMHFLFNMLFLYFSGKMLEDFFGSKRLLYTYIVGGIAGGLFEVVAHEIFPAMGSQHIVIVGASGSIMAIFIGLAFYRPNLQIMLFGILPVRMIILGGLYLLYDILSLGANDGTAHFAHLGGALLGIWAVQNPFGSNNILFRIESWVDSIVKKWKSRSSKSHLKVKKGGRTFKSDAEYNVDKKKQQEKMDAILDKISKSGYESLSKAEKDFLFNQSQNG